ncbi:NTF2-related export protein 1 [Amblyomma americanum]
MAAAKGAETRTQQQREDDAATTGEVFAKLFYETLEKRRHLLGNLFLDSASLLWNGNPHCGKDAISKFYALLPSCVAELSCVDAQAFRDEFVNGQTTVHVVTAGLVKFSGQSWMPYTESFVLIAQDSVWKIVMDTFRFQEPALV